MIGLKSNLQYVPTSVADATTDKHESSTSPVRLGNLHGCSSVEMVTISEMKHFSFIQASCQCSSHAQKCTRGFDFPSFAA